MNATELTANEMNLGTDGLLIDSDLDTVTGGGTASKLLVIAIEIAGGVIGGLLHRAYHKGE